jgi:FAD-dependent urate hydroxylase
VLNSDSRCQFAIVGAGPYGLAVGAHLRAGGLDVRIFGKPMDFWASQMPKGMLLRSPRDGSHISDPSRAFSLGNYEAAHGCQIPKAMPLETFVDYGRWFQSQALPDLEHRQVTGVERAGEGFAITLDDGECIEAQNVVVATGIGAFPNYPVTFASLPKELASHTSDRANSDLGRFTGKRVAVVGGGQSALESAALLHENGAKVEVLVRQPFVRWLKNSSWLEAMMDWPINPFKAPGKIGPIGINWLLEHPRLFTSFPRPTQDRMAYRAIRPAGSSWLRSRTAPTTIKPGCHAVTSAAVGDKVHLKLNDGTESVVDHVLLGTGYRVSVARMSYLSEDLSQSIQTVKGYPVLNRGFESSIPGLYFVGASGAYSFGPLCRFVAGTPYTARTLAQFAVKNARKQPRQSLVVSAEAQRA